MTRAELVEAVYRIHGGISRREAQALVDFILDTVKARLRAGEKVDISGFGTFEVRTSGGREGRHPVTGRRFRTPPRRSLTFRAARALHRATGPDDDGAASPGGDVASGEV